VYLLWCFGLWNSEQESTSSPTTPAPMAAMINWMKHAIDVIIDIVMNAITYESHNQCLKCLIQKYYKTFSLIASNW